MLTSKRFVADCIWLSWSLDILFWFVLILLDFMIAEENLIWILRTVPESLAAENIAFGRIDVSTFSLQKVTMRLSALQCC